MPEELYHFIDGERVNGLSGRFGDVYNPATGDITKRVPLASTEETRKAIASAEAALPGIVGLADTIAVYRFADREQAHVFRVAAGSCCQGRNLLIDIVES